MASGDILGKIADQETLEEIKNGIGNTDDTGGTYNSGTLDAKANAALLGIGGVNNGIDGINSRLDGVVTPYGKGTYGDLIFGSDFVWPSQDGFNRYVIHTKSMTIPEGVTLTPPEKCDGLYILSQGDVTINGTIDIRGKRKTFTEPLQLASTINVGSQEFELAKGGYSPKGGESGRGGSINLSGIDDTTNKTPAPSQIPINSIAGNVNGGGVGQYGIGGASVIYGYNTANMDNETINYNGQYQSRTLYPKGPTLTYNENAPGSVVIIAKGDVIINGNILASAAIGANPTEGSKDIAYYNVGSLFNFGYAFSVSGNGAIPPSGGGAVTIICNNLTVNGAIDTNGYKFVAEDKPDLRNQYVKGIQFIDVDANTTDDPDYSPSGTIWNQIKNRLYCSEGGKGGTFISTAGDIKVYTGVSE